MFAMPGGLVCAGAYIPGRAKCTFLTGETRNPEKPFHWKSDVENAIPLVHSACSIALYSAAH